MAKFYKKVKVVCARYYCWLFTISVVKCQILNVYLLTSFTIKTKALPWNLCSAFLNSKVILKSAAIFNIYLDHIAIFLPHKTATKLKNQPFFIYEMRSSDNNVAYYGLNIAIM